jgi:signal transduction histidine kinase
MASAFEFLKKVPMFADLPDEYLEELCRSVQEKHLDPGEILFTEGSLGNHAYVIREGQIEIYKTSEGREVQLSVRQPGEVIGEMALLESAPRSASGRAMMASELYVISHADLDRLLDTSPLAARTMLHTVTARLRNTTLLLNQSEKLAQLGTLSAGIAHELNNPAAAARRGSDQLRTAMEKLQRTQLELAAYHFSAEQLKMLAQLEAQARQSGAHPAQIGAMERGDLQDALEDWLDAHGVDDAWELAPALVPLGIDPQRLDEIVKGFPRESLPAVLNLAAETGTIAALLEEIGQGAAHISEIVKALKAYVYLDQAPVQDVDVHEGLENTLVILRHKLKQGVEVRREYDPRLPRIPAYGSELNQVWTNIIDNAVDAMDGKGEIVIRTRAEPPWVVVEIQDSGPGIPPEIQPKLFSPFFTTKPMGKGTGLGLNTSYNIVKKHKGEIKVASRPGETRFVVRLPVGPKQ